MVSPARHLNRVSMFQWRVGLGEDGGYQACDAISGRREPLGWQHDHGTDPRGQPTAGVVWQRQDYPQRQLFTLWQIH